MTIPASTRKAGPYPGNDVTTEFAFDFKVFTEEDVRVIRAVTATGVETILTLDSDYSVALNADQDADPGGSVTYPLSGDELPAAQTLTVVGNLEVKQGTDLPDGGAFNASTVEGALDYQNILIQQLNEEVGRAVKVTASSDSDPDALVASLFASEAAAEASANAASASAAAASDSADAASDSAIAAGASAAAASGFADDAEAAAAAAAATALSTPLTGLDLATNAAITAADSILSAFGKLQKQITDLIDSVTGAIADSPLTMATNRLLGRTTAGTGAVEELSVGLGLSLSAGVLAAVDSFIQLNTANGYGSGANGATIRQFTNVAKQRGSHATDFTVVMNGTVGTTITINTSDYYTFSYKESVASAQYFGLSINSTQLNSQFLNITQADQLCGGSCDNTSGGGGCGGRYYIPAGSVIRPHTNAVGGGTAAYCQLDIARG